MYAPAQNRTVAVTVKCHWVSPDFRPLWPGIQTPCATAKRAHGRAQDTVIREAVIMKRQRHPHILELLAAFVDGSNLWMIIPMVPGGSLESLIKKGYPKVYICLPLDLFQERSDHSCFC